MIICGKCKLEKDSSSYFKDRTKANGFHSLCKDCNKIRSDKYWPTRDFSITTEQYIICTICKENLSITKFHKNKRSSTGLVQQCKDCRRIKTNSYYQKTKQNKIKQVRLYRLNNREKINIARNIYQKERMQNDPKYVLTRRLRNRLYYALKNQGWKKNCNFADYIGCSYDVLIGHIEKQFTDSMSWENRSEWHIDHIIPLISANTEEELYKLCHYTNLQPLWGPDNISKADKIPQ